MRTTATASHSGARVQRLSARYEFVARWTTYRALPATAANQRLLSLTARHPQARVVVGARAYMRASQDELGTTHIPRGVTVAGSSGTARSAQ